MTSPVQLSLTTSRPVTEMIRWVETSVARVLRTYGYRVTASGAESVTLTRAGGRAWWLLPFSSLAFWWSDRPAAQVVFLIDATPGGSRTRVIGNLPVRMSRILAEMPHTPTGTPARAAASASSDSPESTIAPVRYES